MSLLSTLRSRDVMDTSFGVPLSSVFPGPRLHSPPFVSATTVAAEERGSLPEHGASRLEHLPLVGEIASPGKVREGRDWNSGEVPSVASSDGNLQSGTIPPMDSAVSLLSRSTVSLRNGSLDPELWPSRGPLCAGDSIHGGLVSSVFNVSPGLSLTGPVDRPTVSSCGPTPTSISESTALPLVSSWDDSRFIALSSAGMLSSSSADDGSSASVPLSSRAYTPLRYCDYNEARFNITLLYPDQERSTHLYSVFHGMPVSGLGSSLSVFGGACMAAVYSPRWRRSTWVRLFLRRNTRFSEKV